MRRTATFRLPNVARRRRGKFSGVSCVHRRCLVGVFRLFVWCCRGESTSGRSPRRDLSVAWTAYAGHADAGSRCTAIARHGYLVSVRRDRASRYLTVWQDGISPFRSCWPRRCPVEAVCAQLPNSGARRIDRIRSTILRTILFWNLKLWRGRRELPEGQGRARVCT